MTKCSPKVIIKIASRLLACSFLLLICLTKADNAYDKQSPSFSDQLTISDLVYPWPERENIWPSLTMTKNYEFDAILSGFQVVEDTSYSYSKKDIEFDEFGSNPFEDQPVNYLQEPVEYFINVKVDSKGNRAAQSVWADLEREELSKEAVIDFENARVQEVGYFSDINYGSAVSTGECKITQMSGSMMSIAQVLEVLWHPSHEMITSYLGHQCLAVESGLTNMPLNDVLGFHGQDAEGGISGSPAQGTSVMTMKIINWKPRKHFSNKEFVIPQCQTPGVSYDVEMVEEKLLPLAEFGLNMM